MAYAFTRVQPPAAMLTANLCGTCTSQLLGESDRRRLDRLLVKAGWAQPGLPGFEALAFSLSDAIDPEAGEK